MHSHFAGFASVFEALSSPSLLPCRVKSLPDQGNSFASIMNAERCDEKGNAKIRHWVIAGDVCDHARKRAAGPIGDSVILLDQAWSKEDREWYYNFSQGSAVIAYDLFLNMEAADSQDLFRNGLSAPRYGLVPQPASPANPDGLPIGVSKTNVATADQGLAGRRLCRHDLCGLPPRATEVQRQAHSHRRRHLKHVRFPGSGFQASAKRF